MKYYSVFNYYLTCFPHHCQLISTAHIRIALG